jgi:hypothetical protein
MQVLSSRTFTDFILPLDVLNLDKYIEMINKINFLFDYHLCLISVSLLEAKAAEQP